MKDKTYEGVKEYSINLYLKFAKQIFYRDGEILTLGDTSYSYFRIKCLIQKRNILTVVLRDAYRNNETKIKIKLSKDIIKERIYFVFQFKEFKKGIKTEIYINNKLIKRKTIRKFDLLKSSPPTSISETSVVYGGVLKNAFPYMLYTSLMYHKFLSKERINELQEYFNKKKMERGLKITRTKLLRLPKKQKPISLAY